MSAASRHLIALSIASDIERLDKCSILSAESIAAIEAGLSRHVLNTLTDLRQQIWFNNERKESALALVDAVVAREQEL